jgi:hypothetical protein
LYIRGKSLYDLILHIGCSAPYDYSNARVQGLQVRL